MPARTSTTASHTSAACAAGTFAVLLLLTACSPGSERSDSASPGASASAGAASTDAASDPDEQNEDETEPGAPATGKKYAGELTLPLDSYRTNARAFLRELHGTGWKGINRPRRCKPDGGQHPECNGSAPGGRLSVNAIHDAHIVKISDIPANGVVIGRVRNLGRSTDLALDIPGHPAGTPVPRRDRYYYVLRPESADTAALHIAVVKFTASGDTVDAMTIHRAPKGFYKCTHLGQPEPKPTVAKAKFSDCDPRALTAVGGDLALAWFSCDAGCCTAQWPPSAKRGDGSQPPTSGQPAP